VFSTASGSLYLVDITWQRALSFCGKPSLTVGTPRKLPVSAPGSTPFCLVNHPQYRADEVLLAVGSTPAMVQVYTIATINGGITGIAMLSPAAANAAQAITGIFGDATSAADSDSGVWLTGPGGLTRHVPFDGATWGAEQVLDVDSSYTLSAVGSNRAGALSGHVFDIQGASLVLQGRPATSAIRRMGADWAVGDNGTVLIRQGIVWQNYAIGATSYRHANRVALPAGSSVELLDTAWNRTLFTYDNTPTSFSSVSPAWLASYVNAGAVIVKDTTIRIGLEDPDSNQALAAVSVRREWGAVTNLLVGGTGDTLGPVLPHTPSSAGGVQLADTAITLVVASGGIQLVAPILRSTVIPGCTTTYWAPDTFRSSTYRAPYDTLLIVAGGDTLRLLDSVGSALVARATPTAATGRALRLVDCTGRELRMPLATGTATGLAVFEPSGRLVGRVSVEAGQTQVRLPFALPRSLVLVRASVQTQHRQVDQVFALTP
jgi:hypothetical protein